MSGRTAVDLGYARPAVQRVVDRHRESALAVFAALDAARRRIKPRARLTPSYDALAGIAGRLNAGKSIEQCLRVIAAYEEDVRRDPDAWRWFDTESPWRPGNFERALARGLPPANEGGGATAASDASEPLLAPDGCPYPDDIVPVGMSRAEAEERVRLMRLSDPWRFDAHGNPIRERGVR